MSAGHSPSITVAARAGFETVDEIHDRLHGVDFPIELALPWRYALWEAAMPRWDEMVRALEQQDLDIVSVHATQGRISDGAFLKWGRMTCELAEHLGAGVVTVHPNRAKSGKGNFQELARHNLRTVQRGTSVIVSVETFGGRDRMFTPEEIIDAKLPMTLDTAHLHSDSQVMDIIQRHWQRIPVVHLSARSQGEHHLPIDAFCVQVVRTLSSLGWAGRIVLEYLPWHHYRIRSDMKLVRRAITRGIRPDQIAPPCDVYRGRHEMWGFDAPRPQDLQTGSARRLRSRGRGR